MQWSKLKSRAEAFFDPNIGDRVALRATAYRGLHDSDGRGSVVVDGREIWDAPTIRFHAAQTREIQDLIASGGEPNSVQRKARNQLAERGIMDLGEFYETLEEYCSASIDSSLSSRNVLTRGLAMLDRRVGRRRLAALNMSGEHPFVEQLYRLRLEVLQPKRAPKQVLAASLPRTHKSVGLPKRESAAIESAIAAENWEKARWLIERALKTEPESHWLLTRLGLTYYEQFDYLSALEYSQQALSLAPDCPLVQWDFAGALDMLDRPREAIKIYDAILGRDIDSLANDACGEGRARARGLRADVFYRVAQCHQTLGDRKKAANYISQSLAERGPGCASIYPISKLRQFATVLANGQP